MSAFPRIGSEFLSPKSKKFEEEQAQHFEKHRRSNPDLIKNDSYLNRLNDKTGRNSMGVAQTGATSGALLHFTETDSAAEHGGKPSY